MTHSFTYTHFHSITAERWHTLSHKHTFILPLLNDDILFHINTLSHYHCWTMTHSLLHTFIVTLLNDDTLFHMNTLSYYHCWMMTHSSYTFILSLLNDDKLYRTHFHTNTAEWCHTLSHKHFHSNIAERWHTLLYENVVWCWCYIQNDSTWAQNLGTAQKHVLKDAGATIKLFTSTINPEF